MTMKLNPYITFRGNAEEAIQAYGDVFGGDVSVSHFREFGMDADGVMHASLTTPEGFTLFVSDHVDGTFSLVDGNNIQVSLSGDDETALRRYWDGLADGGQVVVRAEWIATGIQVAVSDTGVGISPEDQMVVFDEFKQVGRHYTNKHEGTGLGLALTKRFVELYGGTLHLQSALGVGSTFTFTIPRQA